MSALALRALFRCFLLASSVALLEMACKTFPEIVKRYAFKVGLEDTSSPADWQSKLEALLAAKRKTLQAKKPDDPLIHTLRRECNDLDQELPIVGREVRRSSQEQYFNKVASYIQDDNKEGYDFLTEKSPDKDLIPTPDEARTKNGWELRTWREKSGPRQ